MIFKNRTRKIGNRNRLNNGNRKRFISAVLLSGFALTLFTTGMVQDLSTKFKLFLFGPQLSFSGCDRALHQNAADPVSSSLIAALDCDAKDSVQRTVNIFSCAVGGKYENAIPMYAFYALTSNHGAVVEIVVENAAKFVRNNHVALSWIVRHFRPQSSRICVRNFASDYSKQTNTTHTWRFLEVPQVPASYTYIGDVDIFLTESVLDPKRFEQMAYFGLPYSNIIRPHRNRMTGLMLVDTKRYYTPALFEAQSKLNARGSDEKFLLRLVKEAGYGVPEDTHGTAEGKFYARFRPQHGIHLSYNRGPGKKLCQITSKRLKEMYSVADLGDFLCHDENATALLNSVNETVFKQEQGNMTVKGGVCS